MTPGIPAQSWLDPRLETRPSSIHGNGIFACMPIRAGEVLIVWGGVLYTADELRAGKANPDTVAAVDEDLYLADPAGAPDNPDYFLNHSCDPNLWMLDAFTLAARRDIAAGEEICADYAQWEWDSTWRIEPCRCGTELCRGAVTGEDWKLPALQQRYEGHFTPYINRKIEAARIHRGKGDLK